MENIEGEAARAEESAAATAEAVEREGRRAPSVPLSSARALARERLLVLALGALVIGVAFYQLQYATDSICCGDFDAYYHFRWSRMLLDGARAGQFPPSFDALPLTTLDARNYVDHHFLFHVFQIPFTLFPDMRDGAKFGTWLFASLAVFACYWLLVRYRVSHPLVWLVLILGSASPFLYRMHMGKAMSVSIVLLVAGLYLLFERKYAWLLPLAFVFALTYDMFVLLCVAAGLWTAVVLWSERRLEWRPLAFVVGGSLLGYVINPYFPHNLVLIYQHVKMKVTAEDFSTAVGGEWYPYNTLEFLANCGTAFAAMVVGYVAFKDSTRREQQRPLFFLLFATFLMLVNMRWKRFAEYWPPFAVLFVAFALEPLFRQARARLSGAPASEPNAATDQAPTTEATNAATTTDAAADELETAPLSSTPAPEAAATTTTTTRPRWIDHEAALVGIVVGALLYFFSVNARAGAVLLPALISLAAVLAIFAYALLRRWPAALVMAAALAAFGVMARYHRITVNDIASMPSHERYRAGMDWVAKNVPAGEPLYNADWDDFPKLFYYDPHRPYVAGLDPTYLLDRNPTLMKHYERIGKGEEEDPGPIIREQFCVGEGPERRCPRYAFLDREHEAFYNNALDSGWFDVAYEDEDCSVLRIRDQKGDPPSDTLPPGAGPQQQPPDEDEDQPPAEGEEEPGDGADDGR